MISLEEALRVCRSYLDSIEGGCHGLNRDLGQIPEYSPFARRLPICQRALTDRAIGTACRHFYSSLPIAAGESECPYGVRMLFQRITVSAQPLCLYQQVAFSPRGEQARQLPRSAKKTAIGALAAGGVESSTAAARAKFERAKELLTTLLTGRVAESIRAASHHLLTPLQGVVADVDALSNDGPANASADVRARLDRNLREVTASAKQIQILLSDEADFSPIKLRKVPVRSVVQEILDAIKPDADRRDIRLEHVPNQHTRQVEGIPDQFVLMMTNLLQNGVKYSFDGIAESPRVVRVTYGSQGEYLIIRVRNEGCGIEPDEIATERIFELGYRGRRSGDRGRTGTGTGLYVVRKIAIAHSATITVSSRPVGNPTQSEYQAYETTFELTWPVYSPLKERER